MTTYTANNPVPMPALPTISGVKQEFLVASTNDGVSTYAPDGLAPAPIFGLGGQQLQGNEIVSGGIATLVSFVEPLLNDGELCWILVQCAGGSLQVAPAVHSDQAAQLQQVGFQNQAVYTIVNGTQFVSVNGAAPTADGATVFPAPISGKAKYRVWGGGGGSGGTTGAGSASLGGGGGAYAEGVVTGLTGDTAIVVGQGGAGGTGGTSGAGNGSTGGTSSFGVVAIASGGQGGVAANGGTVQGAVSFGGIATSLNGSGLLVSGGTSGAPLAANGGLVTSYGGSSFGSSIAHFGPNGVASNGTPGAFPGGGAAGSILGGTGAAGAAGLVVVDY